MSSQLVFEALWRDRGAAAGLKGLGVAADQSASKYGKLSTAAKVGMLAAGAAILKFGVSSVKAYSESEEAQKQLGFAFLKFPKLADSSQASLQKLNSELQKKTRFDDDAIASGQALLAQFGLTGKQLESVTPLLLDYASRTGKDIPQAANDVGKALLGNAKALKNIGISYKSTGDSATDFANITQLMRDKVGGFASLEGKTAAGQLAILKNQFGELQEAAGAKLVPALTQVTSGLIKGVQIVGQYSNVIGPTVVGIGALATVIWTANKAQQAWAVTQTLSSGLALKAVGGLNALKVAFTGVELTSVAAGRAMRVAQLSIPIVGVALFAASTAAAAWVSKGTSATAAANEYSTAMQSVQGNITRATAALNENVRATTVNALQSKGAFDQARLLGISFDDLTDAALGNEYAIKAVNAQIKSGYGGTSAQVKASGELARTFRLQSDAAAAQVKSEQDRRTAMGAGASASEAATIAAQANAAKSKEQAKVLQDVADKARAAANALLQLSGSQIGMESAIDAASASIKEYRKSLIDKAVADGMGKDAAAKHADKIIDSGRALDINTEAGRKNKQALDSLAGATLQYTDGLIKAKAPASQIVAANERGRLSFIKTARAMGLSKTEATGMAAALFQIPKSIQSRVVVAGGKVSVREAKDLNAALKGIPKEQRARIITIANTKGAKAAQDEIKKVKDKEARIKFETNAKKKREEANREAAKAKDAKRRLEYDSNAKRRREEANREAAKAKGAKRKLDYDTNAKDAKDKANRESAKAQNRQRKIDVNQNAADARRAAQAQMNAVNNVTRYINVKKRVANADGGVVYGLAGGGRINIGTGPRTDDVLGIERGTGLNRTGSDGDSGYWISTRGWSVRFVA